MRQGNIEVRGVDLFLWNGDESRLIATFYYQYDEWRIDILPFALRSSLIDWNDLRDVIRHGLKELDRVEMD